LICFLFDFAVARINIICKSKKKADGPVVMKKESLRDKYGGEPKEKKPQDQICGISSVSGFFGVRGTRFNGSYMNLRHLNPHFTIPLISQHI
jgi:hypothetical protein